MSISYRTFCLKHGVQVFDHETWYDDHGNCEWAIIRKAGTARWTGEGDSS